MSTYPTESPLSSEETALADRVAHRIHDEFRELLGQLPEHVRGGSALSRHLDLNRATCQRIVGAATETRPDRHLLARIPGVQGMRQFLSAMRESGMGEQQLANADAAVDQFEDLLDRVGGSQSKLASRLIVGDLTSGPSSPAGGEALMHHRATLFESAAALCGRSSDLTVTIYGYRPVPGERDSIESFTISAQLGHRAGPHAVPLVVMGGTKRMGHQDDRQQSEGAFESLDNSPAVGRTPEAMLEEFSTQPLPIVTSRGPGRVLLQTVDPKGDFAGRPIDLVVGHRHSDCAPHPATEDPPVQESWSLQHFPSRHLILDVWLHRDLARACIPSVDLHLYLTNFTELMGHRWISRFPHGPRLELLGSGLRDAASPVYPRLQELLQSAFERVGWSVDEFVGHRCNVPYPLWRGGYCITCDFTKESDD